MSTKRMRILADELNELISKIEMGHDQEEEPEASSPIPSLGDWLDTALDAYNTRRKREKVFGAPQLFGEPTWDILLDLFIAELKNTRMQTTSVCIGAQVPQTTALRWIALLEKENLVTRYRDKSDSRRVYIQMTDLAVRKMLEIFYDQCIYMMGGKMQRLKKLALGPGTGERDDAREGILSEAFSQIRALRDRGTRQ